MLDNYYATCLNVLNTNKEILKPPQRLMLYCVVSNPHNGW